MASVFPSHLATSQLVTCRLLRKCPAWCSDAAGFDGAPVQPDPDTEPARTFIPIGSQVVPDPELDDLGLSQMRLIVRQRVIDRYARASP